MDMHVHTLGTSSDSTLNPADLPQIARDAGLTGFNLAEHDQIWDRTRRLQYLDVVTDLFVSFGMEISTKYGHMIAVGLDEYIGGVRRIEKLREELDKVGGFLIVAHPFRHVFDPATAMRTGNQPLPVHR